MKLLSIELGIRCNNACSFCPQVERRAASQGLRTDLTLTEIRRRLQAGRRDGSERVGFSGGEPTVRPDLAEIINAARDLGYKEISITTNGRILAQPGYARSLVEAGLTGLSLSLHGDDAPLHDRLVGIPGAFEQALAGLAILRDVGGVELHTTTLVVPDNQGRLAQIIGLAADAGAKLHILQPFIACRTNLDRAHRFYLPLDSLIQAVEQAARAAQDAGTRVKPFNIPHCMLSSFDGMELQGYRISLHRSGEDEAGDSRTHGQRQFYRIAGCDTCPTPCPGVRLEFSDRVEMLEEIKAALNPDRDEAPLLAGLDLLETEHINELIRTLPDRKPSLLTGGAGWGWFGPWPPIDCCFEEIIFVYRSPDLQGVELDPGNGDMMEAMLRNPPAAVPAKRASILLSLAELLNEPPLGHLSEGRLPVPLEVKIAIPAHWKGMDAPGDLHQALMKNRPRWQATLRELKSRGIPIRLITLRGERRLAPPLVTLEQELEKQYTTEDWSTRLLRHPYADPAYRWVMASIPFWLFEPTT